MGMHLAVCARLKGMKKIKRVLLGRFLLLRSRKESNMNGMRNIYKEAFLGKEKLLPDDLYIFDIWFTWLLVFTHETDKTGVRHCISFGI